MTIRVRSQDLEAFDTIGDVATSHWIGSTISQADAAEVLNIKPTVLRDISSHFDLAFETNGLALTTLRAAILDVAAEVAWSAEIAWHLGVRFDKVERILSARRIPRISTGWSRRHLINEHILPDLRPVPSLVMSAECPQKVPFGCQDSAALVSA